ncbi:MAG: phytanoyl-CoA dioxygenase family protein [Planctomycetota bacterium]|nr:phytanoyl-CoA dioxygenase family protein [Planctomycetota bacterium]
MESVNLNELRERFDRDGYALVRGVLSAEEVARAREITDAALKDPEINASGKISQVRSSTVLRRMDEVDPFIERLSEHDNVLPLARLVLGQAIAHCGHSIIIGEKDQGINTWHIDDVLQFPLDGGTWDIATARMPVLWLTVQIALTDITEPEHGPTEVVPGSQFSGRLPPQDHEEPDENSPPTWNGQGPVPIFCRAGDAYLFNHQVWHRGTLNRSDRPRYLLQQQYCQLWLWGRFRYSSRALSSE